MPMYRGNAVILTGATFVPDLRPNDRFGRNGGKVRIRAVGTPVGTFAIGDVLETVFIGNEMVESQQAVAIESALNRGVDNFVPALEEIGVAADVINIQWRNTNVAARTVNYIIEVVNAP